VSFNVAMLKQMREEGLDFDAAIRVLEAGEHKADPTAAERKRRQRAKEKSQRDVTRDGGSNDIDILTSPENENSEPKGSSQKVRFASRHSCRALGWLGGNAETHPEDPDEQGPVSCNRRTAPPSRRGRMAAW
jgi:hypothetical protein